MQTLSANIVAISLCASSYTLLTFTFSQKSWEQFQIQDADIIALKNKAKNIIPDQR